MHHYRLTSNQSNTPFSYHYGHVSFSSVYHTVHSDKHIKQLADYTAFVVEFRVKKNFTHTYDVGNFSRIPAHITGALSVPDKLDGDWWGLRAMQR